ncbi:hypothetical protein ELUMI_v1c06680 [Williamsoniiplasma luminosum]|uniref:Lipoprotein n=1 Tax=Williamsoniiplasma luminosum TaxID=214888 RepID=A0A2K8NU75_9MOLU|nr:lipoprotein [Williamsoniiplasma luminosum]ATZ17390.1 hypothetical protein ELUMI_v1c06680 [Williamsoniiplasma luminosum]
MKKLLTLLGAISLVAATSATVVACGGDKDKKPPVAVPDAKEETRALIEKLKNEVASKWNDEISRPMTYKAGFFAEEAVANEYSFFTKRNLKEVYDLSALNAKIVEAKAIVKGNKTQVAFDALQTAIEKAEEQLSNPTGAEANKKKLVEEIQKFYDSPDEPKIATNIVSAKAIITTFSDLSSEQISTRSSNLEELKISITTAEQALKVGVNKPQSAKNILQAAIDKAIAVAEEASAQGAKKILDQAVVDFNNVKDEENTFNFFSILTEGNNTAFRNNIENLLDPITKMKTLKSAISMQTYQIILGKFQNNWIEDIKFDYQNAQIQYVNNPTLRAEEKFIANITLDYSSKYKYNDAEDAVQSVNLSGKIRIIISDDQVFIETINDVHKTLAGNLMKSGNPLVWIDQNSLKSTYPEITDADIIGGNNNKYKAALAKYYKDKLSADLPKKIVEDYFRKSESPILKNIEPIANSIKPIGDKDMLEKSRLGAMNLKTIKMTKFYNQPNGQNGVIQAGELERQQVYLGNVGVSTPGLGGWAEKTLVDGTKAQNKTLYNDLKKTFENSKKSYTSKFITEDYSKVVKDASGDTKEPANMSDLQKTIVKHEQVKIQGMSFITPNGYKQELNPISIDLALAVDKTSMKEETVEGHAFAAYYKGIKHNLDVFHRFYGISKAEIDNLTPERQKALVFNMTGKPLDENGKEIEAIKNFNIWDYWAKIPEKQSFLNGKREPLGKSIFNQALNLRVNSAVENAKQIWNEYLFSKLIGSSEFDFQWKQTNPQGWDNLNTYKIDEKPKDLKPGLVLMPAAGPQYRQSIEFTIRNDLFNIKIGERFNKNDWATCHNSGNMTYTLIGKK